MKFINLYAKSYKTHVLCIWVFKALLGLLNRPVAKGVRSLDLQFHLEAFEFMIILFSL